MDDPDDFRSFPDMVGLPTGLQLERVNRFIVCILSTLSLWFLCCTLFFFYDFLKNLCRLLNRHAVGQRTTTSRRSRGRRRGEAIRRNKSAGRLTLDPIRNPPKPKRKKRKLPKSRRQAWETGFRTGWMFVVKPLLIHGQYLYSYLTDVATLL